MKTKAAILFELNKPLVLGEVEIPSLKKGQVLVKILVTGLCRAQLNETKGWKGPDIYLPHLLGHEASGMVMETGKGVRKVKQGDYVVLTWIKGKGLDGLSTKYNYGKKIVNAGAITTFSQYSVVSENRIVKISKKVPPSIASILGCAIPTGVGIIKNTLKAQKGKSIAVFGTGGVGSSVIMGAKLFGLSPIIAIDITKDKLEFAKKMGATHTVNFLDIDHVEKIKKICPLGLDYAVEAAGVKQVMETAFELLHDKGILVIAGNAKKGEKICLTPFDFIKGKRILGTWGGETDPDRDIPYYAKMYLKGKLPAGKLITKKIKLEEINKAFTTMEKNESMGRMVIEF